MINGEEAVIITAFGCIGVVILLLETFFLSRRVMSKSLMKSGFDSMVADNSLNGSFNDRRSSITKDARQ